MKQVRLRPVAYAELSALRHEVAVSEAPRFKSPDFLVIQYFGAYRDGGEGKPDALYILAAAAAARQAWWCYSTILDFRELEYHWGDNMQWITQITWDASTRLYWPMAVVVSDKCRDALRSLLREEYNQWCVESMEEAFALCGNKKREHERCLKEIRDRV